MLYKITKKVRILPNENHSIIEDDDEDIMSNWKSYVEELIKEMRVVHNGGSHGCKLGAYVLTTIPYALILEMLTLDA